MHFIRSVEFDCPPVVYPFTYKYAIYRSENIYWFKIFFMNKPHLIQDFYKFRVHALCLYMSRSWIFREWALCLHFSCVIFFLGMSFMSPYRVNACLPLASRFWICHNQFVMCFLALILTHQSLSIPTLFAWVLVLTNCSSNWICLKILLFLPKSAMPFKID